MTNHEDYADSPQGREAIALLGRVRDTMARDGLSQSELARRCGYRPSYISMLLNDRDGPSDRREIQLSTALHLAHALGLVRIVDDA